MSSAHVGRMPKTIKGTKNTNNLYNNFYKNMLPSIQNMKNLSSFHKSSMSSDQTVKILTDMEDLSNNIPMDDGTKSMIKPYEKRSDRDSATIYMDCTNPVHDARDVVEKMSVQGVCR